MGRGWPVSDTSMDPDRGQTSDGAWTAPSAGAPLPSPPNPDDSSGLPGELRATDQDRDAAVVRIGEGLVSGQLTDDEHESRVRSALAARTVRQLDELTRDLHLAPPPPRRSVRNRVLVGVGAGVVAIAIVAAASVLGSTPGPRPVARGIVVPATSPSFPPPPTTATLTGGEFTLAPRPSASYLGDTPVFSAHGTGSQTSAPFTLDGGVMAATTSQDGSGADFYLVPAGGTLQEAKPTSGQPIFAQTSTGTTPWAPGLTPPAGRYELMVAAEPGTHWTVSLTEFWVTAPGVTVAPSSSVGDLGRPVVVVTGTGNWRSPPFTLPADPLGANPSGGYDLVVGTPVFDQTPGATLTAYLVDGAGTSVPLPVSGSPQLTIPELGPYSVVVEATGPWALEFEFGNQLHW
jgi:hypothetical protein